MYEDFKLKKTHFGFMVYTKYTGDVILLLKQ